MGIARSMVVTEGLIHTVNADLSFADLSFADLSNANLEEANLSNAYLYGADLRDVNLSNANLSNANLRDANLSNANLSRIGPSEQYFGIMGGANLELANLRDANLSNANLAYAKGITNSSLEQQAKTLKGATMPNGQKYEDWLKSREENGKNSGAS